MKRDRNSIDRRRQSLLRYLQTQQSANVAELAEQFQVSPITMRRDIQYFQEKGVMERYFGGVRISAPALQEEPCFDSADQDLLIGYKQRLAQKACEMIEDGDTVFLNSSSTALLILQYLTDKSATIITNNGRALLCSRAPSVELVLTGGEVYGRKRSLVGEFALASLNKVTATKCIIGASGISVDGGITSSVLQETAINQTMLQRCSGPRIVLVDGLKVGLQHNFFSSPISAISHIITNDRASHPEVERLRQQGVQVVFAD